MSFFDILFLTFALVGMLAVIIGVIIDLKNKNKNKNKMKKQIKNDTNT